MRQTDIERVKRYKAAYPIDSRSDTQILDSLNTVRKEKKYTDRWIENQVYKNYRERG